MQPACAARMCRMCHTLNATEYSPAHPRRVLVAPPAAAALLTWALQQLLFPAGLLPNSPVDRLLLSRCACIAFLVHFGDGHGCAGARHCRAAATSGLAAAAAGSRASAPLDPRVQLLKSWHGHLLLRRYQHMRWLICTHCRPSEAAPAGLCGWWDCRQMVL